MNKSVIDMLWVIVCAGLVFMMQAGFLCLESGLTRSKNAINVAIKNLTDISISIILYWMFGFALMFGVSQSGLVGATHFFVPVGLSDAWLSSFFIFQVMFCATATTIVSGAVAERVHFISYIIITIIISGIIYPIFGHWAWGNLIGGSAGWLQARGFVDFAGSTVVHGVGGWVSLAAIIVIGARSGRFPKEGPPNDIPGSNLPLAMLGVLLLFFGWFGFNGGSTLAFKPSVAGIIANTALAGASGMMATLAMAWYIKKIPDVISAMNGTLAGLVAITASCYAVTAFSAVFIGAIGGIVMLATSYLLKHYKIDDAIDAVAVHAGAGVWGTLAVAFFGKPEIIATGLSRWDQLQIQLLGIITCFLYSFTITFALLKILNIFYPLRVSVRQEYDGLNVSEHKARTELIDLLRAMEDQAKTQDMSFRVPVEPFTEVGQIALRYNFVLDSFQKAIAKTNMIVQTIKDGVVTFGYNGILTSFNPGATDIFGYDNKEVIGQPVSQLISLDGMKIPSASMVKNLQIGKEIEFRGYRKDGSHFPAEMVVGKAKVGDTTIYTGVIRDITERKHTQEEIQEQNEALKQSNEDSKTNEKALRIMVTDLQKKHEELKSMQSQLLQSEKLASIGQLAAGIAHEINNPVGFIGGNLSALKKYLSNYEQVLDLTKDLKSAVENQDVQKAKGFVSQLDTLEKDLNIDFIKSDVKNLLKESDEGIDRIKKIVMELKSFTRKEEDETSLINAEKVIEDVLGILWNELKYTTKVKKEFSSPPQIKCNPQKLGQVLINILLNAKQAMENRGEITIKTFQEDKFMCIQISDTGSGIPEENIKKIFDPFFTTKPVGEGTGLGLSICYDIIKSYSGDIQVASTIGKGTAFTIKLPIP